MSKEIGESPRIAPAIEAMVAVAPIAGLLGALARGLVGEVAAPVGVCTALLSAALVWIAVRLPKSKSGATVVALVGGMAAGILNSPVSYVAYEILHPSPPVFGSLLGAAIAATIIGAAYAAPLGLLFGAIYLVPIRAAHALSRDRTRESMDRLLLTIGIWLVSASALCGLAGAAIILGLDLQSATRPFCVALATVAFAGFWAALIAGVEMLRRRRWFRRVAEGREPGWVVTPADPLLPWDAALPALFVGRGSLNGVLARRVPGLPAGAYRTGDRLVPWSVVTLPE